jgi:Spy/CpxP family protein refolding chaperone
MRRLFAVFVLFAAAGFACVFAEPPAAGMGGHHGMMNPAVSPEECPAAEGTGAGDVVEERIELDHVKMYLDLKGELKLTEEQSKAIESLLLEHRRFAIRKFADIKLARLDLVDVLRKDKPDFSAARAKIKEIASMQLELKLSVIDIREKAYNVLTAEQQDKLPKMRKEMRRERMMDRKKGK